MAGIPTVELQGGKVKVIAPVTGVTPASPGVITQPLDFTLRRTGDQPGGTQVVVVEIIQAGAQAGVAFRINGYNFSNGMDIVILRTELPRTISSYGPA